MFYMVCFDITDNKIRYRAVKILKNYGLRVQKSVFECPGLSEAAFLKMRSQLSDVVDHEVDSVRYYFLCRGCTERIRVDGVGPVIEENRFRVV
jgi:CRISPR-associated protein Cas2